MSRLWPGPVRIGAIACALLGSATALGQDDFLDESDLFDDEEFATGETGARIADPIQGVNRVIFDFNDVVYLKVLRPFAKGYRKVVPRPVENGISNFYDNLGYPVRLVANVLQLRFGRAAKETGAFAVNTTLGIAGFRDAAKNFKNLNPPSEDMGQAFGSWGVGHGFYIVLPILGPSSGRDLLGRLGDSWVNPIPDPWTVIDDTGARLIVQSIDIVNDIPGIIDFYESVTRSAFDPYSSVKDGYAQLRAAQVAE